jgi:putative addiction module component (TIGR02574 family)
MTVEQLAIQLLGLPARDRAVLAEKLIASLEEEHAAGDVDTLWAQEAERRLKEVEEGAVSVRPAEAVLDEARSRLKR